MQFIFRKQIASNPAIPLNFARNSPVILRLKRGQGAPVGVALVYPPLLYHSLLNLCLVDLFSP